MKKLLFLSTGILVLLMLKVFSTYSIDTKGENIIIEGSTAKIFVEKDYLSAVEIISFVIKTERGIHRVKEYLGEENIKFKEKVQIHVKDGSFVSTGHGGVVTLSYVKEKKDPYIHELTHVLGGPGRNGWWMKEGFAVYLNDALGVYSSCNFGEDLHELSRYHLEKGRYKEILGLGKRYDYIHFGTTTKTDYIFLRVVG